MHYSESGMIPIEAETGGPFPQMLLASTTNNLCLACHDGTDTDAPDVIDPSYPAAGGYFDDPGDSSDNAHNLGLSFEEVPPGGDDSLILSCASCHNPHGTSNHRNLLSNPAGGGNSADVDVIVSQTESADGPGGNSPDEVYVPSNIVYRSGMADWCNDCHPDFHGASETGTPEPWSRHPQDVTINGQSYADYAHWDGSISDRIAVESPDDTMVPSADDQVFCLSCHKAHGSADKSSLVYADGDRMLSSCQQCHNKAYESTRHGDATDGVYRVSNEPEGDCIHCHDEHASRDGSSTPGGPYDYLLFRENDRNLCYTNNGAGPCHASAGANEIYQGSDIYDDSAHATETSDNGKCLNCHTPHGLEDGSGLIPSLASAREEDLCESCHYGSPASDVENDITKSYSHPAHDHSGRHDQSEDGDEDNFGASNRHAECVDCHNPHYAKADGLTPLAPDASDRIKGVSGVSVINGAAGTQPAYTYISPDEDMDYEYQLCFKCHSSWTTQLGGQPDMAEQFNPNNSSYHPVEAQGNNANIDPDAFVNGWSPTDIMYCTDCHSSDNSPVNGPHGSQYNYILKKDYAASTSSRTMSSDELCFDCHNYDTYANNSTSQAVKGYSRWNTGGGGGGGGGSGHTRHVDRPTGGKDTCYNCHGSHASIDKPHLIVTGRSPGLVDYTELLDGGTCYPTCHESRTYSVNYSR